MFTLNWADLGRIVLIGVLAYIVLVLLLRVGGKRSLTQLNAFDLVITVSIGSVFATIIMDKSISLFDGITAFAVLIGLQWIFSKTTKESERSSELVKSDASLLYYNGEYCEKEMKNERIEKSEIMQAARMDGNISMEEVQAVVLEANGTMSILPKSKGGKEDNLKEMDQTKQSLQ